MRQKIWRNQINCLPLHRKKGKHYCKTLKNAKIAQLVEHNLAKVGVAGSSPVFRSKPSHHPCGDASSKCPGGGIGRHATLRG